MKFITSNGFQNVFLLLYPSSTFEIGSSCSAPENLPPHSGERKGPGESRNSKRVRHSGSDGVSGFSQTARDAQWAQKECTKQDQQVLRDQRQGGKTRKMRSRLTSQVNGVTLMLPHSRTSGNPSAAQTSFWTEDQCGKHGAHTVQVQGDNQLMLFFFFFSLP